MEAHKADFTQAPSIEDIVEVSSPFCLLCTLLDTLPSVHHFNTFPVSAPFSDMKSKSIRCASGSMTLEFCALCHQVDLWARGKVDEVASELKLVGV